MRKIIILILLVPSLLFADRQSDLDAVFNGTYSLVVTFDNYADWTGQYENGKFYTDTPDFNSGRGFIGYQYEPDFDGTQIGPWITDHGAYTLSGKSLRLTFNNFSGDESTTYYYGPSTAMFYFGQEGANSRTTGYDEVYVFYAIKFSRTHLDLVSAPYSWTQSSANSNEYYLVSSGGDPGLFPPNQLIINSSWVNDPVPIDAAMNTGYSYFDDNLGSLATNEWGFGDNDSLGYSTIYVRITGDGDPDAQGSNYIQYESGFFVLNGAYDTYYFMGTCKHMSVHQGFWSDHNTSPYIRYYDSSGGPDTCSNPVTYKEFYGINFIIYNFMNDLTGNDEVTLRHSTSAATWDAAECWDYTSNSEGVPYGNTTGLANAYINGEWAYIEYRIKKGTQGNADCISRVWVYDSTGTAIMSDDANDNYEIFDEFDLPMNYIHIGGNRFGTNYTYDQNDSWDNRYYIDDLIIHDNRIGPTYFSTVAGTINAGRITHSTTAPAATINSGAAAVTF